MAPSTLFHSGFQELNSKEINKDSELGEHIHLMTISPEDL